MTGKGVDLSNSELINEVHEIHEVQLSVDNQNEDNEETKKVLVISDGSLSPRIVSIHSGISEYNNGDDASEQLKRSRSPAPELPTKRLRIEKQDESQNYKASLIDFYKSLLVRLQGVEKRMDEVSIRCHNIEDKVEQVSNYLQGAGIVSPEFSKTKSGAVIVGVPQDTDTNSTKLPMSHLGPNVTLITLNSEEDYPNGSWLGDLENPEMRVRCHISQTDLGNINRNCPTPEKMALTLLDYLFDRETQAVSNISGLGKHGKKQLDPLMIYGIRCHVINKFQISDRDWNRIKQNLDSKCRTAFRRKQKGMPLTVKAFRDRWDSPVRVPSSPATYIQMISNDNGPGNELLEAELTAEHDLDLTSTSMINIPMAAGQPAVSITMEDVGEPKIYHTPQVQVLHATAEQLAQFQQSGQFQILAGNLLQTTDDLQDST